MHCSPVGRWTVSGSAVPGLLDVVGHSAWQYSPYGGSPLHQCLGLVHCLLGFEVDTVVVVVVVVDDDDDDDAFVVVVPKSHFCD